MYVYIYVYIHVYTQGGTSRSFIAVLLVTGLIPGLRRPPGEGNCYPLQYSGLEDSIDRGVQEVTKSQTRLSDFHFHFQKLETNVNHKVFIKAIKVAQMVKNLSAKQNSLVQSLGREDPL